MPYIIIKNRHNKLISINLMGHFKIFIQKYTNDVNLYFTMLYDKYDTCYSNYVKIINLASHEDENIINNFEKKYKDFTMELSDTSAF